MTNAHKFFKERVKTKVNTEFEKDDFVDKTTFETKFAPYKLPISSTNPAGRFYSYSRKICGSTYIDTKDENAGKHLVDVDKFYNSDTSDKEFNTKGKRYRGWKDAAAIALPNVCQFVC